MHKSLIRKALVVGIIILMIGVNVSSSFARDADITTMSPVGFDGNTLYVGGSGPNNYTRIQDAIDNASDGDTVFVYDDSSPYNTILGIYKQINLIGEDKNTTIIDGYNSEQIITINDCNNVVISGFTITNGEVGTHTSDTNGHTFRDNNFINLSWHALEIWYSNDNNIINNYVQNTGMDGIRFEICENCFFQGNVVEMCDDSGIRLEAGFNCVITENILSNNRIGIRSSAFQMGSENNIYYCLVTYPCKLI